MDCCFTNPTINRTKKKLFRYFYVLCDEKYTLLFETLLFTQTVYRWKQHKAQPSTSATSLYPICKGSIVKVTAIVTRTFYEFLSCLPSSYLIQ